MTNTLLKSIVCTLCFSDDVHREVDHGRVVARQVCPSTGSSLLLRVLAELLG